MNNQTEAKAIRQVMENYAKGAYEGDTALLETVFHEKAIMSGYLGDQPELATPAAFIADIGSSPKMKDNNDPFNAEIESIRVEGNVASVIVSETGFKGSATIVDFFHLIKLDGKWSIISKTFTTL